MKTVIEAMLNLHLEREVQKQLKVIQSRVPLVIAAL